ncbi:MULTISPECIES: c-type heme family protein [Calothrix]|uniref:DUF3365 domain-containing protein n=2 Tax=Calothrix TaxID=1186 RepID=A0ABR8A6A8_9CYAN|nr:MULTISPECIES: DUF3365 domain-containing protein [Calothrix]MBD2195516.1 DUF3365 domain-containing protein [Calothrix parietina FACHB-288]MBD2228396.1 DUF3365 domain-containing protein [Calothrix anomala FACHB-343]
MKIGTKVNLILIVVFIGGILISGTALSQVLEHNAEKEVSSKAVVIMQIANSLRQYTNDRVQPLLLPKVETQEVFIPESIPTFSVREMVEIYRKNNPNFLAFSYKDAALNPTNFRDKADDFEADILKKFRQQPDKKDQELSGFINTSGEKIFYTARPFIVNQESCLRCHSTPEAAPKSQITAYGRENGFGWKLHEIVAAQMVYVPAEEIFKTAQRSSYLILGMLVIIFIVIVIIINFLIKKTVIQRIKSIANVAEKVSIGDMEASFGKQDKDEIGMLAEAFNRMKYSLEIALDMLNNNTNIK